MLHVFSRALRKAAPNAELSRLLEILSSQELRIRKAFEAFLSVTRSTALISQARILLEVGDIEAALQLIEPYIVQLGNSITAAVHEMAAEEAEELLSSMIDEKLLDALGLNPAVTIGFNPSLPRASEKIQQNKFEFVVGFTNAQREATQTALSAAFLEGHGPVKTARVFRDSIGLTDFQLQAVANYQRLLEMGDSQALDRALRDRRFDSSVERAIRGDEPLGAERINRMVDRYRERFLKLRAETIARTEGLRAMGLARQEALIQMVELTGIDPNDVTRTWHATKDHRVRDTHGGPGGLDGQVVGINESFVSSSDARLMFPGDTSLGAPAEEVINCRCVVTHKIGGGLPEIV